MSSEARDFARAGLDWTTYAVDVGQAAREEGGLDERGEPLALVPVAGLVPADLPKAHDHGREPRALCGVLEDALRDPFGLAVPRAERGGRVQGHLGHGCRDGAVCGREGARHEHMRRVLMKSMHIVHAQWPSRWDATRTAVKKG